MTELEEAGMASGDGSDSQITRTILLEKRARRLAEEDALRLYNRVRQLQKEEDKAKKRIVETKKKATEIIKLRERNELKLQEKEVRLSELQAEVERQRQDNLRLKEDIIRNKTETENKIFAEKVQVVQQTKDERVEIEKLLLESKLVSRKEALEQKEAVRRAQEDARRKLEQLKVSKLQMVGGWLLGLPACTSARASSILLASAAELPWSLRGLALTFGCCCRPRRTTSAGSGRRWMPRASRSRRLSGWCAFAPLFGGKGSSRGGLGGWGLPSHIRVALCRHNWSWS